MTKVGGSKVTKRLEVVTIDKLISPAEGPLGVFVVFVLTFAVAPRRLSLLLGIALDWRYYPPEVDYFLKSFSLIVLFVLKLSTDSRSRRQRADSRICCGRSSCVARIPTLCYLANNLSMVNCWV
jgi:hypothetical protein